MRRRYHQLRRGAPRPWSQGIRPVRRVVRFNFPVSEDPGCNGEHQLRRHAPGIRWIVVDFAEEMNAILPADLPNRADVVVKAAVHLAGIVEANKTFNLTRITSVREAVIKHVLDSVLPWNLFAEAPAVLDAGTGAGFPGVPLAVVLWGCGSCFPSRSGRRRGSWKLSSSSWNLVMFNLRTCGPRSCCPPAYRGWF